MQEATYHNIDEIRLTAASFIEELKDFGQGLSVDERLDVLDDILMRWNPADWQRPLRLKADFLRLTSSKEKVLAQARQLRQEVYHFDDDFQEDTDVQDITARGVACNRRSCALVAALQAFDFTPNEEAEILLSAWLGIHVGFNNPEPFNTITARVAELLPSVSDRDLSICLKMEQTELFAVDEYFPEIEAAIAEWQAGTPTEDQQWYIRFFEIIKEEVPYWETEEEYA